MRHWSRGERVDRDREAGSLPCCKDSTVTKRAQQPHLGVPIGELAVKTLYVMRHAKSDWSVTGQSDFDRPLNARGRSDLPRMAATFDALEKFPEEILCSPAARARETAAGLAPIDRLRFEEELYLADPATLSAVLARAGTAASALVVAHNPGVEGWIDILCGARVRMPTAAVACIQLDVSDWKRVSAGCGQLQWLVAPRLLKALGLPTGWM